MNYPPPNTYDPKYRATVTNSPTWGLGTSKRPGLTVGKSVAPGCQTYAIPSRAVEGSKWSMGLKLDERSALSPPKKTVPPPGAYDPDYRKAISGDPRYTLKGRHAEPSKMAVPGPGTYERSLADKAAAPRYGFGTGK